MSTEIDNLFFDGNGDDKDHNVHQCNKPDEDMSCSYQNSAFKNIINTGDHTSYFGVKVSQFGIDSCLVLEPDGLGINCLGDPNWCSGDRARNAGYEILELVKHINLYRLYPNGEHIICLKLFPDDRDGYCVFAQNMKGVPGRITGSLVKDLVNQLLVKQECELCGSVPIYNLRRNLPYFNDPGSGILTINYVDDTFGCDGICGGNFGAQALPDTGGAAAFTQKPRTKLLFC